MKTYIRTLVVINDVIYQYNSPVDPSQNHQRRTLEYILVKLGVLT